MNVGVNVGMNARLHKAELPAFHWGGDCCISHLDRSPELRQEPLVLAVHEQIAVLAGGRCGLPIVLEGQIVDGMGRAEGLG